jgi:hypothetical protein
MKAYFVLEAASAMSTVYKGADEYLDVEVHSYNVYN